MIINDSVYGQFEITEPVLIELITSQAIQRLRGVSQLGIPDKWYFKKGFSRYDHSLGTMLLLQKLGAPLRSQIVGLMHDAGHTAFSHVADFVFDCIEKENINDQKYFSIISSKEISAILNKHGFSAQEIKDILDFPLVKRKIPDVCADTLDYCLRELTTDGLNVDQYVNALTISDNKIIFTNRETAHEYALEFLRLNNTSWASPKAVTHYVIMRDILKMAIDKKIIDVKDLDGQDMIIIKKIQESGNTDLLKKLHSLETGNFNIILHKKKIRYCDPEFLDGTIKRLSEEDSEFKQKINF
jgi:uncharacterized protein